MIDNLPITHAMHSTRPDTLDVLHAMAEAASRAPSGDNLQPWTFVIDAKSQCLEVWLETHSDPSSLNPGQRMSLIACGSAIECAACIADDYGWTTDVQLAAPCEVLPAERLPVARVYLRESVGRGPCRIFQRLIDARTTNRHLYDCSQVAADTLTTLLRETLQFGTASVCWITERNQINACARLAADADVMLFSEDSMRRAFLKNVRFDLPARAPAERGLPLGALEISAFERLTLRSLCFTPDWLFKLTPAPWLFARYASRLVRSASGLCIVSTLGARQAELSAGRAMLRAWLALTAQGMAVHPMMSGIAMTQAIESGSPELIRSLGLEKLRAYVTDFRATLAMLGVKGSPQFLMRFGRAAAPTARTCRMPLAALLRAPQGPNP